MKSEHHRHDQLLVSRYASGDPYPAEKAEAEALVASCSECTRLAADIRLISSRIAELPAPRRTRDFRLTPEQADQLTGSWLQRVMRGFASPRWNVLRPVAGAAFAIGLTLAVVGALPLGSSSAADGSLTTVPEAVATQGLAAATDAPAIAAPPGDVSEPVATDNRELSSPEMGLPGSGGQSGDVEPPAPGALGPAGAQATTPADRLDNVYLQQSEPPAEQQPAPGASQSKGGVALPAAQPPSNGRDLLVVAGLVLAAAAVGLLMIAWLARRRYADPLLR